MAEIEGGTLIAVLVVRHKQEIHRRCVVENAQKTKTCSPLQTHPHPPARAAEAVASQLIVVQSPTLHHVLAPNRVQLRCRSAEVGTDLKANS
eukprot:SAG11_NODE_343_length_10455_cov_7.072036_3_plen_92_part_00